MDSWTDGVIWNGSSKEERKDWRWADTSNVTFLFFVESVLYVLFIFVSISFHRLGDGVEFQTFAFSWVDSIVGAPEIF
ncbi:hypothetical protein HOY82DRAFT_456781, partial [Tuber indicum]